MFGEFDDVENDILMPTTKSNRPPAKKQKKVAGDKPKKSVRKQTATVSAKPITSKGGTTRGLKGKALDMGTFKHYGAIQNVLDQVGGETFRLSSMAKQVLNNILYKLIKKFALELPNYREGQRVSAGDLELAARLIIQPLKNDKGEALFNELLDLNNKNGVGAMTKSKQCCGYRNKTTVHPKKANTAGKTALMAAQEMVDLRVSYIKKVVATVVNIEAMGIPIAANLTARVQHLLGELLGASLSIVRKDNRNSNSKEERVTIEPEDIAKALQDDSQLAEAIKDPDLGANVSAVSALGGRYVKDVDKQAEAMKVLDPAQNKKKK